MKEGKHFKAPSKASDQETIDRLMHAAYEHEVSSWVKALGSPIVDYLDTDAYSVYGHSKNTDLATCITKAAIYDLISDMFEIILPDPDMMLASGVVTPYVCTIIPKHNPDLMTRTPISPRLAVQIRHLRENLPDEDAQED